MRAASLALLLMVFGLDARAQSVRLQLYDHIVGTELAHNAPLPSGTDVFVVSKAETRAVRLRGGYSEVVQGFSSARRDRLGANGQTQGTYVPTARSGRAYYVAARLPDGRIFQSFVKTADAGWQPGFDALTGGRVSMGRVTGVVEATLRAALPARAAARAAAPAASAAGDSSSAAGAGLLDDSAFLSAADTLQADSSRIDSTGTDTTVTATTPLDSLGAVDEVPPGAVRLDEPETTSTLAPWWWGLAGLVLGAGLTALVLVPRYERRLKEQREHLVRLVPDSNAREAEAVQRRVTLSAASEADSARADRTLAHIEQLKGLVRSRDAEIQRLRSELDRQGE